MSFLGKIGQTVAGMPGMNTMMKPVQGFMNKSPLMSHSPLMQHMQNRFNPQQKPGLGPSPNAAPMQQMAQNAGQMGGQMGGNMMPQRPPEQQMPYQPMEGPQNTGILKPGMTGGSMMSSDQGGWGNTNRPSVPIGNMGGLGPSMGGLGQMMQQKMMNPKVPRGGMI